MHSNKNKEITKNWLFSQTELKEEIKCREEEKIFNILSSMTYSAVSGIVMGYSMSELMTGNFKDGLIKMGIFSMIMVFSVFNGYEQEKSQEGIDDLKKHLRFSKNDLNKKCVTEIANENKTLTTSQNLENDKDLAGKEPINNVKESK